MPYFCMTVRLLNMLASGPNCFFFLNRWNIRISQVMCDGAPLQSPSGIFWIKKNLDKLQPVYSIEASEKAII